MAALEKYKSKRHFDKTPEPAGDLPAADDRRFVVQKHDASHLHYDFRLQVGDKLVSWAVPKGISANPADKHLAVKVEDHPVDYQHFEGVIPDGNYGAGTVLLWDTGTYWPEKSVENTVEAIDEKIRNGSLKFSLEGQKLKGFYSLYRIDDKGDQEQWIITKSKDKYADANHRFSQHSVVSGLSLDEIASGRKKSSLASPDKIPNAHSSQLPDISPMLATLADAAFDNPEWIFEIKWDGYRIIATRKDNQRNLFSRNGNPYDEKFSIIHDELIKINHDFVMDGEVVVLDQEGKSDFQTLQHLDTQSMHRLYYYVFDLVWLDGYSLLEVPLLQRKELLRKMLPESLQRIRYCDHIPEKGKLFFDQMKKLQMEGMIAKRAQSKYYPGKRSDEWLKVKTAKHQEAVIVGYTAPKGSRTAFGALLLAINENGRLRYAGKVGTGFDEATLQDIFKKLQSLKINEPPVKVPAKEKAARWVEPKLIAEVQFTDWTREGAMRHPVFRGLRSDKKTSEIVREDDSPVHVPDLTADAPENDSTRSLSHRSGKRPSALNTISHPIPTLPELSNPDKIFWPNEKILKKDVYQYYNQMADVLLPYLINRPQSLLRSPDGVKGGSFFQKDVKGLVPEWIKTVEVESSSGSTEYLLCQNKATLLFMVNWGSVELNPWNASVPDLDKPDYVVFDLDPVEIGFEEVVRVALGFDQLFEELKLPFYCKTSGSRGIHIYLPVLPHYTHDQGQQFARLLETIIHERFRKITSFERSPAKRKGKIYLDYLQNGRGKTMASVYSLRLKPGATVSTPVTADELKAGIDPAEFNIHTMQQRLKDVGDLWKDMLNNRVDISAVLKKL
ncbi:MAG: DNA ligase D [Clostridia bacterium]|nr:DNA ligase D [Clostridia bacterium]